MKYIGVHLSISKGIHTIQEQMELLDSETCGIFLKNQKRYSSSKLTKESIRDFKECVINPAIILPHGSYLINFANAEGFEKSYDCLADDLSRCTSLGIKYYNVHPGANVNGLSKDKVAVLISNNINRTLKDFPSVTILIENMAGQGTVYGRTFEEIKAIIDNIEDKDRIGVTLDTCHMFAGGYDIRQQDEFERIMKNFNEIVGIKYLKAMHLNDSKEDFNSRKDRHESIGKGKIGLDAFKFIMNSEYFENMPMILETPSPEEYKAEIALLKSFIISNNN